MPENRNFKRDVLLALSSASLMPHRFRASLLRRAGLTVGEGTLLMGGIAIVRNAPVSIGHHVFMNFRSYLDATAAITIGDNVSVGDNVRIVTSTHEIGSTSNRAGKLVASPISLEAGSWIGSGATILPGVSVGSGCIVAAGAVVTKDCLPDGLYAGVPAKRIRDLA